MKDRLHKALKTKGASFGFNTTELRSIAEILSNDPTLTPDATEDDINARIEAVLPILKVSQQFGSRLVAEVRKDGKDEPAPAPLTPPNPTPQPTPPSNPELSALLEQMRVITAEIATLKGEREVSTRTERLRELVKDSGAFGAQVLRSAGRMKFESEDDFEAYLEDVKTDLEAHMQEVGDKKLDTMTGKPKPKAGGSPEVASEEDTKAVFG